MNPTNPQRGFTLVETMVAIILLAVALIGPYVAVQNAVQGSYVARDQLIASQLAQEGVEYIRSVRDNNYHAKRTGGWLDGFNGAERDACFGAPSVNYYCYVDPTQGDFHTVPNAMREANGTSSVPYLYVSSNGLYNQQSLGTASKFKRLVRIYSVATDPNGNTIEVKVVVYVLWQTGTRTYTVTVTDNLQDWI